MGFLRLSLAIIVLWGHTLPANCNQLSLCAVEIFFVISGFYMELIKDKYPSTIDFYKSRFIRIFVLYYVVLATTIISRIFTGGNHVFGESALRDVVLVLQNVFIFGQDFLRGMFYKDGHLYFHEVKDAVPLWNAYLGQAWSIAIELTFYLCVPFLLRLSTKKIITIMLISLWARFEYLTSYRSTTGNWNTLFPGELCFFLMGSLACKFYKHETFPTAVKYLGNISLKYAYLGMVIIFAIGLTEPIKIFSIHSFKAYLFIPIYYPILFAIFLPFLFNISKNNTFDNYIGNLSYGVYMWHILIVELLVKSGLEKDRAWHSFQIQTLLITLVLAILSYHFIEAKVDKYRHKNFLSKNSKPVKLPHFSLRKFVEKIN